MALPDVPGVLRVELKYTLGEDINVINRFYLEYTGSAPAPGALAGQAGNVASSWNGTLAPYCTTDRSLTEVVVTDLSSSSGAQDVWTGTHGGSRGGTELPAGTCALLNMTVHRRYRGGKPRLYFPYFAQGDLHDAQTWDSTSIADLNAAWPVFVADAAGDLSWTGGHATNQVNVSYYEGYDNYTGSGGRAKVRNTLRAGGPVVDLILSWSVNPHVASQRRRNLTRT